MSTDLAQSTRSAIDETFVIHVMASRNSVMGHVNSEFCNKMRELRIGVLEPSQACTFNLKLMRTTRGRARAVPNVGRAQLRIGERTCIGMELIR